MCAWVGKGGGVVHRCSLSLDALPAHPYAPTPPNPPTPCSVLALAPRRDYEILHSGHTDWVTQVSRVRALVQPACLSACLPCLPYWRPPWCSSNQCMCLP